MSTACPNTVAKAREWVVARRHEFEDDINEKLNHELGAGTAVIYSCEIYHRSFFHRRVTRRCA